MASFENSYKGRRVFLTGHTGFKGAWLALWLQMLGAEVTGYSLDSPTTPNLFSVAHVKDGMTDLRGDIRDASGLLDSMQKAKPDIVFHLAAQALVLPAYESPMETFAINAQGTVHLLEAIRHTPSVQAAVVITTDKVYENHEWPWGYRETDVLGGKDPYSASKAMAELACASYRESFFRKTDSPVFLASARAGNVIGGGDFAPFRILPDSIRSLLDEEPIAVRNPHSIRPWLHVLEALRGYLLLGQRLLERDTAACAAWNFGPQESPGVPVRAIVEHVIGTWGAGSWKHTGSPALKKEMGTLRLNWEKAASQLSWHPFYTWEQAIETTVAWYKAYALSLSAHSDIDLRAFSLESIAEYDNRCSYCEVLA